MKGIVKLIADSGSTKTEWCLLKNSKKSLFTTQGMSPYFLNPVEIEQIIIKEVFPFLGKNVVSEIYFMVQAVKIPLISGCLKKFLTRYLRMRWFP